ncbi:MAG: hypothetical protein M3082_05160 [Candidatus Dormibacteraeota bacterium]|nr:hypothetical protein [Candidatus Dormibacteraeota bacterium]
MTPQDERKVATDLFNRVWELMEMPKRTREDDDEMLHAAHASRYHWGVIGRPENRARGEWQISRVYTVLGRGEPAIVHAQRCLEVCEQDGIADWDLAYGYEALARAHKTAGHATEVARFKKLAREAGDRISEGEDREHFDKDYATL